MYELDNVYIGQGSPLNIDRSWTACTAETAVRLQEWLEHYWDTLIFVEGCIYQMDEANEDTTQSDLRISSRAAAASPPSSAADGANGEDPRMRFEFDNEEGYAESSLVLLRCGCRRNWVLGGCVLFTADSGNFTYAMWIIQAMAFKKITKKYACLICLAGCLW